MKKRERARLYRVRPNMLLGNRPHALALQVLASRRRVWDCSDTDIEGRRYCYWCYRRCGQMPCILLPTEAYALMRIGETRSMAVNSVTVGGVDSPFVEALFAAPVGLGGNRFPMTPIVDYGAEGLPCSLAIYDGVGAPAFCALSGYGSARPIASCIRACYNWKSEGRKGIVAGVREKLRQAELMFYGLAVYMWNRKYGRYVSALWKEQTSYGL